MAWGEEVPEGVVEREQFLCDTDQGTSKGVVGQAKMRVFLGVEWLARDIRKDVANTAVYVTNRMESAEEWEEWSGGEDNNA